ncbi:Brp/Blh family beta-carotene 15,15'-dioxygenase [Qipengyuania sp. JC766]|uniref:Brp/Blh family beta-carotene 15,15'-dioxygenase n=1 Tax=Qipengyuania sp. JC766 TaxID=3232139 RepID=UPI003459CA06
MASRYGPTLEGSRSPTGALLVGCVLLAAVVALLVGGAAPTALGLALFVAGLAHGAGDEGGGRIRQFTLIHAAAYLIVGAAVTFLFLVAPLAALAMFLILSAWHFARDGAGSEPVARLAIALLAVGGSAVFRPAETAALFDLVLGIGTPAIFMRAVAAAGVAGVGLGLFAIVRARDNLAPIALAIASVALFPPVLGVALVFLLCHALPVQRRQIETYGMAAFRKAVALPVMLASAGAILLAAACLAGFLSVPLAAAIAFGLATPHMLTERLDH